MIIRSKLPITKLNFVNVVATCLLFCFFKGVCLSVSLRVCSSLVLTKIRVATLSHIMPYVLPQTQQNTTLNRQNIIGVPPQLPTKT